MKPLFYDAHIHYFFEGPFESLFRKYTEMDNFLGGCLLMFEEVPGDMELVRQMVPKGYHHLVTENAIHSGVEAISLIQRYDKPSYIPYIDTRFFKKDDIKKINRYVKKGYRGIKILYVPEYDENIGIEGWERSYARSVTSSEQITADLISESIKYDLPVLFHADLRRYGSYVSDILNSYPSLFVNIPHFGSSRKEIARFLERFENCYTDFSSLLSFMKDNPAAYKDFIKSFSKRILFGSDAVFGHPPMVKEYMDFAAIFLEEGLLDEIARQNYLTFHKIVT